MDSLYIDFCIGSLVLWSETTELLECLKSCFFDLVSLRSKTSAIVGTLDEESLW